MFDCIVEQCMYTYIYTHGTCVIESAHIHIHVYVQAGVQGIK